MITQKAINQVEIFSLDEKTLFVSAHQMKTVPMVKMGGIPNSELPLFYGINDNATKEGVKGCWFELYDAALGEISTSLFYEHDQDLDIIPSPTGDRVIVLCHKFTDETGQSYYG